MNEHSESTIGIPVKQMVVRMRERIVQIINRFCFSKHHDSDCNGCMFKTFKKCPAASLHDRVISKIT